MKRRRNSMSSNCQKGNTVEEKVDAEIGGPSFADLPCAITTTILLTLPIKSVLICRCVCKSWNTLISDPHFAKLHFKRAPLGVLIRTNDPKRVSRTLHLLEYEPEKFETYTNGEEFKLEPKFKLPLRDANMVLTKRDETNNGGRKRNYIACKPRDDKFAVLNSCNGLLCLCDPRDRDPLVVSNPVTGEFIRLPISPRIKNIGAPINAGFGFHQKTNEYKVIRMHALNQHMVVEMHTLGTSTWRNIGGDIEFMNVLTFPTCVNETLHWISTNGWRGSILCFNFETEKFQSFPSPPIVINKSRSKSTEKIHMGELRGFLYICDISYSYRVRMWMMKKYGIGESWSQVLSIDPMGGNRWPYGLFWPINLCEKGVLMYHSCNCFIYYEHKSHGFKYFKVRGTQSKFEAIPHIPSLIPLKDAVKEDNVEVFNVHSRCAKFKLREENEVLSLFQEDVEVASDSSSK